MPPSSRWKWSNALGYLDVRIEDRPVRPGPGANIDLQLKISEGSLSRVGQINIRGNVVTRDKVIRGTDLRPGRFVDKLEFRRRNVDSTIFGTSVKSSSNRTSQARAAGVRDLLVLYASRLPG